MLQTILLIQDNASDAKVVQDALHGTTVEHFHVEWVRSLADGLARLVNDENQTQPRPTAIAAVLVDLMLPDGDGIETFDSLFRVAPQIPILVLTAPKDEDLAKLAVQHGAQDYLLKARLDSYMLPKALRIIIERAAIAEALYDHQERAQVTLDSIGDAVISTDVRSCVTYLNAVAEGLTGWSRGEAEGRPIDEVFRIVDATSGEPAPNPMALVMRENRIAGLTPNCVLIRRDGVEATIEDSIAPIHNRRGQVSGAVMVFRDVSSARGLSLRMSYLAQHDCLTELPNRILLTDRLIQAIAVAQRNGKELAVLFLDVDRFKHINDSLGHDIGDHLLQAIAQRLLACVRSTDTVSRQGGDEFVILLSEVSHAQDAAVSADKILEALRAPYVIDQREMHITASIGIVTYPDDGTDVGTLVKHADVAMYHAKESGRDNYQFFTAEMNLRASERQSLENDLRHAIERREFVLHYQTKVNLETGAIIGVEALIRWHHPQHGLVPPVQFIPVAEDCGVIVAIGRWVLREGCRQARAWQDAGLPPVRISINVSPVELRAKDFVDSVRTILAETGLEPSCLELELTETFLMQDSTSTSIVLQAIREMGVHLALDDFGTGYSSLSYLKRFPIDTVKIDQSFVRDVIADAGDASIVGAVIGMGKRLHMQVVAEGIETPEQLKFLREQNCPEGQGYYFSRPVVAEKFAQLLGRDPPRWDARTRRPLLQTVRR